MIYIATKNFLYLNNENNYNDGFTLETMSKSKMAFLPILAATMISSCLQLFPAATALAVASVTGFVALRRSSAVAERIGGSFES